MLRAIRTLTFASALLSTSFLLPSYSFAQQLQNKSGSIQIANQMSEDTLVVKVTKPENCRLRRKCKSQDVYLTIVISD